MTTLDDAPILVESDAAAAQRNTFLADQLEAASNTIEVLQESLAANIELAREDAGWRRMGLEAEVAFTREGLGQSAKLCRVLVISNPIMKRAVSLRTAYIWGSGVSINARATGANETNAAEQDVDAVVQEFLADRDTLRVLTSAAARIQNERTLGTDGNLFAALWTDRGTGKVRPRLIPFDEVVDVITNPEDRTDRWFFLRQYVALVTEPGTLPGSTRVRRETRRVLYPSIDYRPAVRPDSFDGMPIEWDAPVAEMQVNGLDTWTFGIGDAFAALPWARAYAELLTDWARLFKALSRIAFRTTNPTSRAGRQATEAQRTAAAGLPAPNGYNSNAGATVNLGPGQGLEAVPKTGAIIDSDSGRPIAAMVAAAMDVPVTMVLSDPGVTGARAMGETLDKPTELMATLRRDEWADYLRRILDYVIDQAAKAPGGALKRRRIIRDRASGRETVELAGDTDRTIEIVWPDLSELSLKDLVTAIATADGTEKLPPLEILKLLLAAFNIRDTDEILAKVTDEDGNWIDPTLNAGQAEIDRFQRGQSGGNPRQDDPADEPAA